MNIYLWKNIFILFIFLKLNLQSVKLVVIEPQLGNECCSNFTVLTCRFRMCFLLFGVMGIIWMMEVISWAVGGPDYLWYATDAINTLQGIIIFCIFVLEPRVRDHVRLQLWPKLSEIICNCCNRPAKARVFYKSPQKAAEVVNGV